MRGFISIYESEHAWVMSWFLIVAVFISSGNAIAQSGDSSQPSTSVRPAARFGVSEVTTFEASVVSRTGDAVAERCFLDAELAAPLADATVDNAELILTVSAICDTAEPLIIAAFPATQSVSSRVGAWPDTWTAMTGGFDPQYMAIATVESSTEETEIRLDITQFVRLWQSGDLQNNGVVIKALTEEKSSFEWIRDGRYSGSDAKLVTLYSTDTE